MWALGCLSRHNEQSRAWISEVSNDYSAHAFFCVSYPIPKLRIERNGTLLKTMENTLLPFSKTDHSRKFQFLFLGLFILLSFSLFSCKPHRGTPKTNAVKKDTATAYIDAVDFDPIINVYLENSGSINGYVKGVTEFEQIIYNYLVNLKLAQVSNVLNLYYINSTIIPRNNDLDTFIKTLEPSTFHAAGGTTGTSDIADMIKMIMQKMDPSTISIFISDCIFSPGSGHNAEDYLTNQQVAIKKAVGDYYNQHPNIASICYRCISSFDGLYYDKNNSAKQYKGKRPFYIWLFGTQGALNRLNNQLVKNRYTLKDYENEFIVFGGGKIVPDSCYAIKPGSGSFRLDRDDPKHTIKNLKADHSGRVKFTIEVNNAPLILNDDYLCNTSMYQLSDTTYKITSVERIQEYQRYTHRINIESDKPRPATLDIFLKMGVPLWPEDYNDPDGGPITDINSEQTFGIKYMTDGVAQAILRDNYYTMMTVNINK